MVTDHIDEPFSEKVRRCGNVLWVFFTHTLYIVVAVLLLKFLEYFLHLLGMSEKLIPIPFFPQPVALEQAFLLFDFSIIVLFYLIAFKEIAELHGVWKPSDNAFSTFLRRQRGSNG